MNLRDHFPMLFYPRSAFAIAGGPRARQSTGIYPIQAFPAGCNNFFKKVRLPLATGAPKPEFNAVNGFCPFTHHQGDLNESHSPSVTEG
jgi:hypothetical protein